MLCIKFQILILLELLHKAQAAPLTVQGRELTSVKGMADQGKRLFKTLGAVLFQKIFFFKEQEVKTTTFTFKDVLWT